MVPIPTGGFDEKICWIPILLFLFRANDDSMGFSSGTWINGTARDFHGLPRRKPEV
jgi:hypothetical protein